MNKYKEVIVDGKKIKILVEIDPELIEKNYEITKEIEEVEEIDNETPKN